MTIKAEEIAQIIRDQIGGFAVDVDVAEVGTVVSVGDGIARVHGIEGAMAGRDDRVPARRGRHRPEPRGGQRRHGAARRGSPHPRGRPGEADRAHHLGAGGPGAAGARRERARPADRRQGTDRHHAVLAARAHCPGRGRSPAGEGTAADGTEGHRRDGPDRAGPARADHRRPADGQDGRRRRHDHQPEGPERHLHLQRDRAEAVDGRAGRAHARGAGRAWTTRSSSRPRRRIRPRCCI